MIIRSEEIRSLGACRPERFDRLFGTDAEISIDNCLLALALDPRGFFWLWGRLFPVVPWRDFSDRARLQAAIEFCRLAEYLDHGWRDR